MQPFQLRPFRPAWWLPGAHAQTLGGRALRRASVQLVRERITTPDGDFLDLDHAVSPGHAAGAPVALVLHGLEGSSRSGYMVETYARLTHHGIHAVGLNFRSCGGELNRTPRFYHAGDTADVRHALAHLALRFRGAPLGAIGYSLGGNVLLKMLGEDRCASWLRTAVSVSVPFDLAAGGRRLESGFARVYAGHFLRSLKRKLAAKGESSRTGRWHRARGLQAATLREFDDAVTAPLHGFDGVDHYYAESSSARYLPGICVPTLLLHAEDDPFLPPSALPRDRIRENPFLTEGIVPAGGHVGFVGGRPWSPTFWAEAEAARFLAHHLQDREAAPSTSHTPTP